MAVTGESPSHSSFSSSAKVIQSFAHIRGGGGREVEQKTNDIMFANLINSYVIYGQTNRLHG